MVAEAAALSFGAWLYLLLGHGGFWRIRHLLLPSGHARASRVAVVIPARNESTTIRDAVLSLMRQDWAGDLRVYVVDDGSSDGTAELAQAAGATLLPAGPLPAGWTWKMWAVSRGIETAREFRPDYFLLTDADIVHEAESVQKLAAQTESGGYDLVSVMVRLHCERPPERLLMPAFVFFFFMLYPPKWIAHPGRRTAGAAGGCVLIRPEALQRIGGIAAIRGELIDDCALAREVKRIGGSVWLGLSSETRSVRKSGSFGEIGRMISRTAFTQLRYSPWLLVGTVCGMALLYVAPVAAAFEGSLFGALAWIAMSIAYIPMVRFYRQPWLSVLLLPAAAVFYTGATLHSAVAYWTGRGGAWKGRHQALTAGQNGA